MKREIYMERARKLFEEDKIDADVFWAMMENADVFCEDDDEYEEDRLPQSYAEIEYDEYDSYEAVVGSRWDDMNYQHYMER